MNTILEITDLSKNYRSIPALSKLNMKIEQGMVFGILGPNGSGKTTTLGILLGVLNPSSGTYSWFENGTSYLNRQRIGALLETPNFFPYLNAIKNLQIVARIKDLENVSQRIDKVLKIVDLYERRTSIFKTFSLGMKQRLAIASALLSDPEVLVLDEPTNGLDPQGIAEIRNLIKRIAREGKTILIASHALDEIEKVCTDVVILKRGEVIRQSSIENVVDTTKQMIIATSDNSIAKRLIEGLGGATVSEEKDRRLILDIDESLTAEDINKFFFENGMVLSELSPKKKSLESQFLEIIKE